VGDVVVERDEVDLPWARSRVAGATTRRPETFPGAPYHGPAVATDVQLEQRAAAPLRGLEGKVAIVTGAARDRGIGRGIALVLAERGVDVVVNDVGHDDEAARRVAEIEERGRRAAFVKADVSCPEEVERLIAEVVDRFGSLDVYVSNAGVQTWEELADVTPEAWRHITGVNLHGCFYGCRAAGEQMRRQGRDGRIVVVSSIHYVMPFPMMGVYGATKHAVGLLVGVMAREWARDGITVNHVGPGWVDTDINNESPSLRTLEARRTTLASIPLHHRPADPREIGEAVAWLASEAAAYVTGAYLRIDAGIVLGKY
jgi:NAD(P)-dependent dehydrogenase (short-subunit alcohol dehydrogenase family)